MNRERIIERERRWATPAALASFFAVALFITAVVVRASISSEDQLSDQLLVFDRHSGSLFVSSLLTGAAFLLFSVPLLYLFRAAQARSDRVQPALVAFCFIGPLLIGAQGVVNGLALSSVASDYAASAPQEQTRSYPDFLRQVKNDPTAIEKVTLYTDSDRLEVQQQDGTFYSSKYPPKDESHLLGSRINTDEDADGVIGNALAQHLTDDSTAVTVSSDLVLPAALGIIIVMVYVPLQALRVGLLTRFAGTLGMALGVSLIFFPPAPLFLALWFGYVGLMFLGRVRGGRPPAWEAGEAIPWPKPGEEPTAPERSGETVAGSATEVEAGDEAAPSQGAQAGSAKQKRKRRR